MTDNDMKAARAAQGATLPRRLFNSMTAHAEALDRIDALSAEIERLREALQKIANGNTSGFPGIDEGINETFARELMACREVARAALGETLHVAETRKENGETFT